MRISIPIRLCAVLPWVMWLCTLRVDASLDFIQITDPHLFEKLGEPNTSLQEQENKVALTECVAEINELGKLTESYGGKVETTQNKYRFIIVTGDLGIENLADNRTQLGKQKKEKGARSITEGAKEVAAIINNSHVLQWLFVPGNNDLDDERPETIFKYHEFLNELAKECPKLKIRDLCPPASPPASSEGGESKLDFYQLGDFCFVGFNNASFKNNNFGSQANDCKSRELRYVDEVAEFLKTTSANYVYIFYHIPEIDDPYRVSTEWPADIRERDTKEKVLAHDSNLYSGWMVDGDIRRRWDEVVQSPKVIGLFAGHFHDPKRNIYMGFEWMQSKRETYPSVKLRKLLICPPLAVKRQEGALQARGFRDVSLDNMGNVQSTIYWREKAKFASVPTPIRREKAWSDPKRRYGCLIHTVCLLGWLVVCLPSLIYLIVDAGWQERRQRIFSYFKPSALKEYYKLYFPSVDISSDSDSNLKERFKKHVGRHYGRRHFIVPLAFLALISGIGAWGVDETIQSWQNIITDGFTFPAVVVSSFLGAYTWVLFDQLARLRSRDFSSGDVCNSVFRFLIAVPFGYSLAAFANPEFGIALGFLIGVFPTATLFTIGRRIGSQKLGLGEESGAGASELETLQNVNRVNAERFQDEGVTTIAELAWIDPVDLAIRTNFDFNYVVDCMSQALLAVYFGSDIKKVHNYSLRGAQEASTFLDILDADPTTLSDTKEKNAAAQTLIDAAAALGMQPGALYHTLSFVRDDPYTKFLYEIWGT